MSAWEAQTLVYSLEKILEKNESFGFT